VEVVLLYAMMIYAQYVQRSTFNCHNVCHGVTDNLRYTTHPRGLSITNQKHGHPIHAYNRLKFVSGSTSRFMCILADAGRRRLRVRAQHGAAAATPAMPEIRVAVAQKKGSTLELVSLGEEEESCRYR
jgi:hypothetical protein